MTKYYGYISKAGHGKAFHTDLADDQLEIDDDDGWTHRIEALDNSTESKRDAALGFMDATREAEAMRDCPLVLCHSDGRYWIEADHECQSQVGKGEPNEDGLFDEYLFDPSRVECGIY